MTPETSNSTFSFTAEAGGRIKFSFASNIKSGELDIILYDSKGNVVEELLGARELEAFATLEGSDTYTLQAECEDFTGNFKVAVYKAD